MPRRPDLRARWRATRALRPRSLPMRRGCVAQRNQGGERDALHNPREAVAVGSGWDARRLFAANSLRYWQTKQRSRPPESDLSQTAGSYAEHPWVIDRRGGHSRSYAPVAHRRVHVRTKSPELKRNAYQITAGYVRTGLTRNGVSNCHALNGHQPAQPFQNIHRIHAQFDHCLVLLCHKVWYD